MRDVIAVRHVHFEDLGSFEEVLRAYGTVRYRDAGRDRLLPELADHPPDLLVVLGGPVGAYQDDAYPFLAEETALLRSRLARGEPVLGVCLGAQLIAAAAGGQVGPATEPEIGWGPVELTAAGAGSPLAALTAPVLHWHGDTFTLPPGAVRLASTARCRNQAFAIGRHVLGLQFHAEVTEAAVESWLIGHAVEIARTPGITVPGLRTDGRRHAARLAEQGSEVVRRWLGELWGGAA